MQLFNFLEADVTTMFQLGYKTEILHISHNLRKLTCFDRQAKFIHVIYHVKLR